MHFKDRVATRNHPSGFTLSEILIALAIFAILAVVAFPNLALYSSGYKLRGAAREVATDLQFARLLAVKENNNFRVNFDSHAYQVIRISDGSVVKSRNFNTDYPDVTLANLSVDFYSRGGSNGSTVTLTNPKGTKNITVNSTGRVIIQ